MNPILFLYGNAPHNFQGDAEEVMAAYPTAVLDHQSLDALRDLDVEHESSAIRLYVDSLGASYSSMVDRVPPAYFPGPRDWGGPDVITSRGVRCYRVDEFYLKRYYLAVWALNSSDELDFGGLFLDDYFPEAPPGYWNLTPAQRSRVWPLQNRWAEIMLDLELALRGFLALRGRELIVNGAAHQARRLWESVGEWVSPQKVMAEAKRGDAMLVKGLKADGKTWATTVQDPEITGYEVGTSFKKVFTDCLALAEKMDLRIGLCYRETPTFGGSTANVHDYINPLTWEDF